MLPSVVEALLALKNSLTAGQDALLAWKNDGSDPCSWAHVTCNDSRRVTQLCVILYG